MERSDVLVPSREVERALEILAIQGFPSGRPRQTRSRTKPQGQAQRTRG